MLYKENLEPYQPGEIWKQPDLAETLNLPQPTTSRHLKKLRHQGLVVGERDGLYIYYRLADIRIIEALDLLRTILNDRLTYRASLVENYNTPEE